MDRGSRVGVLIVDDQADIRTLLRLVLETADGPLYVSGEAADGQEALERLDDCDPTVIVLDQMMPGLDGIETARRIRQRRPDQLMIMCSAYMDEELKARARSVGIRSVISKAQILRVPDETLAVAAAG